MFASIYIPDFPVEAIVRVEPRLRKRAVAALEGKPPLIRVIALNEKARMVGMEVGMTKLQASIFVGTCSTAAVLQQRSIEQENSAHSALLNVAHAFTPRVENTAPDTLLLDLAGLGRLYGAPAKMAHALASRVNAIGLEANLAVAANPDAAMHAARGFNGITVIPEGDEEHRLGALPVKILLDAFEFSSRKMGVGTPERERAELLDTLKRWGVWDFRALACLPAAALASRLGEVGVQLQCLARGAGMRTLLLSEPPAHFEEAMELESPVETLEPLSFILSRLLEQLCARLEARALAVQELHLRLQLERRVADEETTTVGELNQPSTHSHNVGLKPFYARTLRLPVSLRDPKVLLKLLQLELAAHPPGAPATKVWIATEPAPPRSAQRGLFLPVTPEAEKLEITLARISGIVGERRAGSARLLDAHRPHSFQIDRFAPPVEEPKPSPALTMSDIDDWPFLGLRIFRPACRLRVRLLEGRPVSLAADKQTDRGKLQGNILWSAGPWRSSGDWWTERAKQESSSHGQPSLWDREEWDIALANGRGSKMASLGDAGPANVSRACFKNRSIASGWLPQGLKPTWYTPGDGAVEAAPLPGTIFETCSKNPVALYRIYRDLATGNWFADASYD
jgi:protein ImuB